MGTGGSATERMENAPAKGRGGTRFLRRWKGERLERDMEKEVGSKGQDNMTSRELSQRAPQPFISVSVCLVSSIFKVCVYGKI